jgi:spore coat polysaccharide biosynthesis predicted glycosyltransferase SpsG/RimJ/RimL family protein N-acetyltransferase
MLASPEPGSLLLVPDVGVDRGLGHLQRSLSLGEAWNAVGGETAALVPRDRTEAIDRMREAAVTPVFTHPGLRPAPESIAEAAAGRAWCVFDGYELDAAHHRAASAAGHVAVIDDHGRTGAVGVDVIIDHNPGASADPYRTSGARLLTGARYTLIRAEHRSCGTDAEPRRLVVVMGGSPGPATTEWVDSVLAGVDVPEDRIDLVGLAISSMRSAAGMRSVARDDALAPVFRNARVALSAAGSTTWELAAAGTASVLVSTAPNQVPVGEAAAEGGAACYLGQRDSVDPRRAAEALSRLWADREAADVMAARGLALVDGRGPTRVVAALRSVTVSLRAAEVGDAGRLWTWANDRRVREMAFNSNPIPWVDHVQWFRDRLADDSSRIYLAEDDADSAWGQVRFDAVGDGEVLTSVSIDAARRGQGLAAPLLVAATNRLHQESTWLRRVIARVKSDNHASLRAFTGAGFSRVGAGDGEHTFEWRP